MTARDHHVLLLHCDAAAHDRVAVLPDAQFTETDLASCRRLARSAGWHLRSDGRTICPAHDERKRYRVPRRSR